MLLHQLHYISLSQSVLFQAFMFNLGFVKYFHRIQSTILFMLDQEYFSKGPGSNKLVSLE